MSNKVIIKKQPILFNSIDEQRLSYANQLTVKSWNDIINILRVQTNTNTAYIKQLHNWLVGNTGEDITIPENDTSFVEYVLCGEQSLERLDVKYLYVQDKEVALKENVVDLTSTQTITGPKTFSSQVAFNKDAVLLSGTGVFRFGDSSNVGALGVLAYTEGNRYLRPGYHGVMDLGDGSSNGERWRNLYMTGTVYAGEGLSKDGTATLNAQSANEFYTLVTESDIACINYSASPVPGKHTPSTYYFGNGTGVSGMKSGVIYAGNIYQNDKQVANKDDVVDLTSVQTITGAKIFAGTVGNVQTESGVYLGIDENVGAPNANIAITSANTAAYIDMGPPNKDYGFRLIKWNNLNGKYNAELCYGDDGSGQGMATITIPRASGTLALTSNIPPIDNASGVQDLGWTQADYNNTRLASINKLAHWNGAYDNSNASNLKYGVGGELAYKSDIDNVMQVAEGKTETYVIKASDNDWFNSNMDEITVIFNPLQLITVDGTSVNPKDLKIGDIILVKELDVPDRYVGSKIASNTIKFYKMETSKIDLSVKQDTLVSGENIKTIDGKSLLGRGDITTYNLIYSNAGPTDTIQAVITQIKKYLNIADNEGFYRYVGHIRYTGYKEYLNGYIDLQVRDNKTNILIQYNNILNQKHCYVSGNYAEIVGMSIDSFLDKYMVPNSPTKTSQLENDSNFLTEHQDISGKADKTELDNYLPLTGGTVIGNIKALEFTLPNGALISSYSGQNYKDIRILAIGPDDDTIKSGTIHMGTTLPRLGENSWSSTFTFDMDNNALYSSAGDSLSLGLSDKQWWKVYGKQIYQDGKQVANKEDIPTKVSQLENDDNYTTKENTGATLDVSIDNTTYVMTLKLCNSYGNVISTDTVDLPLETMVISARYEDGKLYLTTKDGNELEGIDISNIVSGLVPNTRTVNGKTLSSDITLNKTDVGLSNVDNTSDANKPISTATAAALALKADKTELDNYLPYTTGTADSAKNIYWTTRLNSFQLDIESTKPSIEFYGDRVGSATITPNKIELTGYSEGGPASILLDGKSVALQENIPTKLSQLEEDVELGISEDRVIEIVKENKVTKTSELTNDSGFITNAVNNLTNYYLKSETYTKSEVQQLLSTISGLKLEVVTNLPTTNISSNTIYLKPLDSAKENNIYEEYIYVNSKWETIGTTAVDLSNYALKAEIPTKTSQLTNDSNFLTKHQDISGKVDRTELNDYETKGNTGATLDVSIDNTTYVMTLKLCNSYGNVISTDTVDLPLETMVISARYEDGKLYLTTKDGNELEGIDISNIVSGLVPNTRTVNGKTLSSDITLNKADVGLGKVNNVAITSSQVSQITTNKNNIARLEARINALESAPRSSGANYNDYY